LGGIDISHAMRSSRQDVIAEVRRRITQLASGGGYILAPSNHLQADVPAENVVVLFQSAQKLGKYPLQVAESE
jgi:uroporphyrinogen decarboxylase